MGKLKPVGLILAFMNLSIEQRATNNALILGFYVDRKQAGTGRNKQGQA